MRETPNQQTPKLTRERDFLSKSSARVSQPFQRNAQLEPETCALELDFGFDVLAEDLDVFTLTEFY